MAKRSLPQAVVGLGVVAAVTLTLPGFLFKLGQEGRSGLILVNGRIEGTEVAVGSKLAGRVGAVHVNEGQEVKKGDLLAVIDTEELQAALEQARAGVRQAQYELASAQQQVKRTEQELAAARASLELIKQQKELAVRQTLAAVREAEAGVRQAQALLHKAESEFTHAKDLQDKGATTELEFTFAEDALKAQQAAVEIAQGKLQQAQQAHKLALAAKSEIQIRQHELAALQIGLRQAQLNADQVQAKLDAVRASEKIIQAQLDQARIVAPCNGIVISRVCEPGEVLAPGAVVVVLVDFDQLYLKGYLPSKLIGKVKLSRVRRINQQAEFTPKNVDTPQQRVKLVFGIEIHADNPARLIKPGMPGDAVIRIDPSAEWASPHELR